MRVFALGLVAMLWTDLALAVTPQTVVLQVKNMTCPACSITIEKALDKVPGVSKAQVNTEAATVTVSFDAERTSVPALARAISDAGFPAKARPNGG